MLHDTKSGVHPGKPQLAKKKIYFGKIDTPGKFGPNLAKKGVGRDT